MNRSTDAKSETLREHHALHRRPTDVTDELFLTHEFFDPRDLVQVKYEMLRRVQVDRFSVSQAAETFGFSRPSFYQILAAFHHAGLPGLIAKRRGPKTAHKLTDEVLEYLQQLRALDEVLRSSELSEQVLKKFGVSVHPRSVERALLRRRKKGR
jgi:transposase